MAKEIINNATLHNYGVDGMREISERRAATIANIIDEGAKYGLSDQFVYDAIAKYGKDNADAMRAGMKEPDSFREFADTFGTDHNKDIYEMEIIEKTDDKLSIDFHYCPYVAQWEKLKNLGVLDWIRQKKESGAIRNIGFSYHGNTDGFQKILSDYDWDICMIQYNYFDENSQAGVTGLKAAASKGIPVVIMEPLRGGKLVNIPAAAKSIMRESGRAWSPAEWGFRWLFNQPEVTVVLSGMNTMDMVRENVRIASEAEAGEFTQEDFDVIDKVRNKIREVEKVGCTGCRYCMPCPQGVDIPGTFRCYNAMYIDSKSQGRYEYAQTVGLTKDAAFATQCIGCGTCEKRCPQNIPIREKLKEADRALRPLPYKIAIAIVRKFMFRKGK